jgi:hypothetical protein
VNEESEFVRGTSHAIDESEMIPICDTDIPIKV